MLKLKKKKWKLILILGVPAIISAVGVLNFQQIKKATKYWIKINFRSAYVKFQEKKWDPSKIETDLSSNTNDKRPKVVEEIDSELHGIVKTIFNANDYLHHQLDKKSSGSSGGYIDSIGGDKFIGVSGLGKLFIFDSKKNIFYRVKSNLSSIYESQNYKGKIIPQVRGKFSIKDIFFDREASRILVSLPIETKPSSACYGMSIYEAKTNSLDMFGELRFKKFFSTDACNENFNGHATGGRIKKLICN